MKKCKSCGAYWQDNRSTCLDCGAVLDDALSEEEEREVKEEMSDALYDMSERTADFYVSPKAKILGILAFVGCIAGMVLLFLANGKYQKVKAYVSTGSMYVTLRTLEQASATGLLAFLILLVTGCLFLFPKIMWTLSTLKYQLFYDWDTTPSDTALLVHKILAYVLFFIGMIALLYGYWMYL